MELSKRGAAVTHKPPLANGPTITPLFGGTEDGPDVGLVRLELPVGAQMPAHRHHGSDIIISPVLGVARVRKGEETVDVQVGDSILITKDEEVSLANPTDVRSELLIAAGPAHFIAKARNLPPA